MCVPRLVLTRHLAPGAHLDPQITGSLARRAIKELAEAGLIRPVGRQHQAQLIYTRAVVVEEEPEEGN